MFNLKFIYRLVLLLLVAPNIAESYKILVLIPFPSSSHFLMFKLFIKELVNRGHEVTSITAYPIKDRLANYTEVLIEPEFSQFSVGDSFTHEKIFEMKFGSQLDRVSVLWSLGLSTCEHAFKSEAVKNFINSDETRFDLVLAEQFFQESMLMFAHKYQAPIVTLSTFGYFDFMDRAMGSLTPYSTIPHWALHDLHGVNMNFFQRGFNFFFSMVDAAARQFYYMPAHDQLARKYFNHLDGPLPSVFELEKSIAVMLVNSHFAMIKPRPLMPGMINIAGAHIQPVKPLPEDLQKFLDGAEHGVILMSLGSLMQSSKMPQAKKEMILSVFGSLKQRVLWKFETDDLPTLPPNVMVLKWLPQSDILAHPNLVLFISHGGLFGTVEASYRGVPLLFMPFFGDQFSNAELVISRGYAEKILFTDLTVQLFRKKIEDLTGNKKYRENAKEVSRLLNDNPMNQMDVAMFWIEYVVRNKGAKHLKSIAVDLPWYKYLLVDVLGAFVICLWLLWKLARFSLERMSSKKANDNHKKTN